MRLVLLVAVALLAGCTTVVPGAPSAPTGVLLPPRPREVRLDGVDPCALLTAEQRAALGLDGTPRYTSSYVELFRGTVPRCVITGYAQDPIAVAVGLVTTVGIERWLGGDLLADVSRASVRGFPAVVAVPRRFTDFCSVEVDVAPGQLIDVQFSDGGGRPPLTQPELCDRGGRVADAIVQTLSSR